MIQGVKREREVLKFCWCLSHPQPKNPTLIYELTFVLFNFLI